MKDVILKHGSGSNWLRSKTQAQGRKKGVSVSIIKKRQLALASQSTITSHFNYRSATVTINKETFIRGILQMVMSGVPLRFFESQGFLILSGEMARKLGVSLSRDSIRRYITDAASRVKKVLMKNIYFIYLFICVKRKSAHKKRRKKETHTKKGLQSCINNSRTPMKNSELLPNHLH